MADWRTAPEQVALSWQAMPKPEVDPDGWRDWALAVIAANPLRAAQLGRLTAAAASAAPTGRAGRQCVGVTLAAHGHFETDDMITWGVADLGSAKRLDDMYGAYCDGERSGERRVGAVLAQLVAAATEMLAQPEGAGAPPTADSRGDSGTVLNVGPGEDTVTAWRRCLATARETLSGIDHESTT